MHLVQQLSESFDQMKTMATSCGFDLSEAVASGALSGSNLRDGAFRCRGCKMSQTCRLALAANAKLEAVPEYCANRALFAQLPRLPDPTSGPAYASANPHHVLNQSANP